MQNPCIDAYKRSVSATRHQVEVRYQPDGLTWRFCVTLKVLDVACEGLYNPSDVIVPVSCQRCLDMAKCDDQRNVLHYHIELANTNQDERIANIVDFSQWKLFKCDPVVLCKSPRSRIDIHRPTKSGNIHIITQVSQPNKNRPSHQIHNPCNTGTNPRPKAPTESTKKILRLSRQIPVPAQQQQIRYSLLR